MKINISAKIFFYYFCIISVIFLPLVFISHAEGFEKDKQNFLLMIPKKRLECKKKSQKGWDSGITSEMIKASFEYGDCLKKIIIELGTLFYPKDAFGYGGIEVSLEDLQKARLDLYWNIYNNCKSCDGTMWHVVASAAAFDELENILHRMSERILREGADEYIDKFESDWNADKSD